MDHTDKYKWIIYHPKFTKFGTDGVIKLTPHKKVLLDKKGVQNTTFLWYVEMLYEKEIEYEIILYHDYMLDCGGKTAEEAINNLYNLIITEYGKY